MSQVRLLAFAFAGATTLALFVAGPHVRADDSEDAASSDDLFGFAYRMGHRGLRGNSGWRDWWFAHRTSLLHPSYRSRPVSAGMVVPPDVAARERARQRLIAAIDDGHWLVASEAALALGRLGDARDIERLSKIVLDKDLRGKRRLHRYGALALGMLPRGDDAQAVMARNALTEAIAGSVGQHDQFAFFWANCAYALAMRGDIAAVPRLLDIRRMGLSGVDTQTVIHTDILGAVAYPLAVLAGDAALPELTEHLHGRRATGGGSKDTSWCACHALTRVGGQEATRLLREAALDPDEEITRRVAISALGTVTDARDDATAALLIKAMTDDRDDLCRSMAAVALGRTCHASAAPTLLAAFETGNRADDSFVALGLGLCAREKADPKINEALLRALGERSSGEELKTALALACGLAHVEGARARLVSLLDDKTSTVVAMQAAFALGLLGIGAEERKALHDVVARPGSFETRREAALALGMNHDSTVVAQLRDIAASKSGGDMDRATAAATLGRVGDDADIDFLLGLLDRPGTSIHLRASIVHGLGWLLDRTENAALGRIAADSLWFWVARSQQDEPIEDVIHLSD